MHKITSTLAAVSMAALITGCGQVDTGEAGFFTRWGEITSREPLSDGLHFYEPIGTCLITYNIKNQTQLFDTEVFTKDIQSMKLKLSVTFNLEKTKIMDLHAKTGQNYSQILIQPSVLGATKDAIGKLEADVIVSQREVVTKTIEENIRNDLKGFGINVAFVKLINIDYSDAFERAVEEKQVQMQRAQQERNKTNQIREQSQQQVILAEANAKQVEIAAQAQALKIKVESEALAKSIEIRAAALAKNQNLIMLDAVNKWDGRMPTHMFGSNCDKLLTTFELNREGGK